MEVDHTQNSVCNNKDTANEETKTKEMQVEEESFETPLANQEGEYKNQLQNPKHSMQAQPAEQEEKQSSLTNETQEKNQTTNANQTMQKDNKEEKEETKQPKVVGPKEWHKQHNKWLQCTMRVAMGDNSLPSIPTIKNIHQIICNDPIDKLDLDPARQFITRYNLCMNTVKGENQVELIHQAITKWFQKVCKADNQAIIYPWKYEDSEEEILENPMDIPNTLIPLKKYFNKLFPHTSGGNYHIQVILGTDEEMDIIMQTIGWWLKSMAQGMWWTGLQLAEETMNAGWLLFSADKYNCKALVLAIWEFIGVQVTITTQGL